MLYNVNIKKTRLLLLSIIMQIATVMIPASALAEQDIKTDAFSSAGGVDSSANFETYFIAGQSSPPDISEGSNFIEIGGFFAHYFISVDHCLLGDVNMNETITPGDALCAFQIFLNAGAPPAGECDNECALEASDADCNGNITPGDALIIFVAFLNNIPPPLQCPPTSLFSLPNAMDKAKMSLPEKEGIPGEEITIPVRIDNPIGVQAFGFQLSYPEKLLTFIRVAPSSLTKDWHKLDGQENRIGLITIGGFDPKGIRSSESGSLVEIIFRVKEDVGGNGELWLTELADDLLGAEVLSGGFSTVMTGVRMLDEGIIPTRYALAQNHPNPFSAIGGSASGRNAQTEIIYQLPQASEVNVSIYSALGELVCTLVSAYHSTGRYVAVWNGRDDHGMLVPSGVYIYKIEAGRFRDVKKMVLIK